MNTDGRKKSWTLERKQAAAMRARQQWVARKERDNYHDTWSNAAQCRTSSANVRQQLSVRMKERWSSGAMEGVITPAVRAKMSASLKRVCKDPEVRRSLSARVKAAYARGAYDNRVYEFLKPSGLEMKLAAAFDKAGVLYVQQYRPDGYWRYYDFLIHGHNLLIEVDGEHWHITPSQQAVDNEKTHWAVDHGFMLLRIPEVSMGRAINMFPRMLRLNV